MKALKSGSPSDPCPAKVLASIAEVINPALNRILSASLESGLVPDRWKKAKILPLLKKPKLVPEIAANYRPISLLPSFLKFLEKYVNNVITTYAETNQVFHQSQLGFRSNFSTETTLLEVSEAIKETLDKGGKVVRILLDLSAAFDTVPHDQLLLRLQECGYEATVLW